MSLAVASPPFSLRPLVLGLPVLVACFAVEAQEAVELEAQQITAPRETERGHQGGEAREPLGSRREGKRRERSDHPRAGPGGTWRSGSPPPG